MTDHETKGIGRYRVERRRTGRHRWRWWGSYDLYTSAEAALCQIEDDGAEGRITRVVLVKQTEREETT